MLVYFCLIYVLFVVCICPVYYYYETNLHYELFSDPWVALRALWPSAATPYNARLTPSPRSKETPHSLRTLIRANLTTNLRRTFLLVKREIELINHYEARK